MRVMDIAIILESCYNNYEIVSYPNFLFVVFDVLSYSELKANKDKIKPLTYLEICFKENAKSNLSSIIACPFSCHYSSIIVKYKGTEYDGLLKNNKVYYHDDLKIMDILLN